MLLCFVTEKFHYFVIFFFDDAKLGMGCAILLRSKTFFKKFCKYLIQEGEQRYHSPWQ